ncbi:MAG: DUF4079 domain-containing protein [Cyanobacteria bacterium P01_H01_bin.15]
MSRIEQYLEPIAAFFRRLGTPEPIVHWGHPLMMGIVVFVLGTYVAIVGWKIRNGSDAEVTAKSREAHRILAPMMFIFISLGYIGGVLSLVMQNQPIFSSPHFWTGTAAIALLGTNATLSLGGFGGQATLRTAHAYLGSAAIMVLFVHAAFGLRLGLSF